jgi:hypothetical protein
MCGADQAHPIEVGTRDLAPSNALKSFLRTSILELSTIVVIVALITSIFAYNFAPAHIEPAFQSAQAAGTALRDLREQLSVYAI